MEMSWMETIRLLGLDLLALMLMVLVLFELVEQAVHSAWLTMRTRKPRSPKAAVAPRVRAHRWRRARLILQLPCARARARLQLHSARQNPDTPG